MIVLFSSVVVHGCAVHLAYICCIRVDGTTLASRCGANAYFLEGHAGEAARNRAITGL